MWNMWNPTVCGLHKTPLFMSDKNLVILLLCENGRYLVFIILKKMDSHAISSQLSIDQWGKLNITQ